jgi:hypothetical protein
MVGYRKPRKEYDHDSCLIIYNDYMNSSMSMREVGVKYDITEKTVFNIVKKIKNQNRQLEEALKGGVTHEPPVIKKQQPIISIPPNTPIRHPVNGRKTSGIKKIVSLSNDPKYKDIL